MQILEYSLAFKNACAREYLRSSESDHIKLTGTNQSQNHLHNTQYHLPYGYL